jgi:hypothetical protein
MTLVALHLTNIAMLLAAIGAAAIARRESQARTIGRWRVLAPGLLSALSVVILVAFPEPLDLIHAGRWLLVLVAFLAGAVRGYFMGFSSDKALGLVRAHRSPDVLWVAMVQLLFALVQFGLDMASGGESTLEPTIEFLMMCTAGYLLGRGVVAWLRAGGMVHEDLRD